VKSEILQRVRFNTDSILTNLTNTQHLIQLHIRAPNDRPWQEVRDTTRPLIGTPEGLGKKIDADSV
jgi:hypothetical protein